LILLSPKIKQHQSQIRQPDFQALILSMPVLKFKTIIQYKK